MTEQQMNPEIRDRWVAALRSGEYQQGMSWLRIGDKFCCLGVLCDIAVADGVINVTQMYNHSVEGVDITEYDHADQYLPASVREWAGIKGDSGVFTASEVLYLLGDYPVMQTSLVELNDNGKDFNYIADRIEEYF